MNADSTTKPISIGNFVNLWAYRPESTANFPFPWILKTTKNLFGFFKSSRKIRVHDHRTFLLSIFRKNFPLPHHPNRFLFSTYFVASFFKSIFFYLRISKRPQPDYYYYASENSFQIKQNESGTNTELTWNFWFFWLRFKCSS